MRRTCPISSRVSSLDILRSLEHPLNPPVSYSSDFLGSITSVPIRTSPTSCVASACQN